MASRNSDPVLWLRDHPLMLVVVGFIAMCVWDILFPNLIHYLRPL